MQMIHHMQGLANNYMTRKLILIFWYSIQMIFKQILKCLSSIVLSMRLFVGIETNFVYINPYTVKGGGGNDPWLTFLLITFER